MDSAACNQSMKKIKRLIHSLRGAVAFLLCPHRYRAGMLVMITAYARHEGIHDLRLEMLEFLAGKMLAPSNAHRIQARIQCAGCFEWAYSDAVDGNPSDYIPVPPDVPIQFGECAGNGPAQN